MAAPAAGDEARANQLGARRAGRAMFPDPGGNHRVACSWRVIGKITPRAMASTSYWKTYPASSRKCCASLAEQAYTLPAPSLAAGHHPRGWRKALTSAMKWRRAAHGTAGPVGLEDTKCWPMAAAKGTTRMVAQPEPQNTGAGSAATAGGDGRAPHRELGRNHGHAQQKLSYWMVGRNSMMSSGDAESRVKEDQ